jgi:hypothetical protein
MNVRPLMNFRWKYFDFLFSVKVICTFEMKPIENTVSNSCQNGAKRFIPNVPFQKRNSQTVVHQTMDNENFGQTLDSTVWNYRQLFRFWGVTMNIDILFRNFLSSPGRNNSGPGNSPGRSQKMGIIND